jgi:hypothetical protein
MSRVALRHVIGRQEGAGALVTALSHALGVSVSIEDAAGRLLHGERQDAGAGPRFPVTHAEQQLGWV